MASTPFSFLLIAKVRNVNDVTIISIKLMTDGVLPREGCNLQSPQHFSIGQSADASGKTMEARQEYVKRR
jgi:hypothetical protein